MKELIGKMDEIIINRQYEVKVLSKENEQLKAANSLMRDEIAQHQSYNESNRKELSICVKGLKTAWAKKLKLIKEDFKKKDKNRCPENPQTAEVAEVA